VPDGDLGVAAGFSLDQDLGVAKEHYGGFRVYWGLSRQMPIGATRAPVRIARAGMCV
jgi:hypothetical protein